MTRIERRRLIQTSLFGLTLTALVLLASLLGWLDPIEYWLYHRRARYCQLFTPPPTDTLVHLDIDDPSLDLIGAWPWPRSHLAEILEQLDDAGAHTVAFDVIFPESQEPRYEVRPDGSAGELIHDDRRFADAIENLDRVMIPFGLKLRPNLTTDQLTQAVVDVLKEDPERTVAQARQALVEHGWSPDKLKIDFESRFVAARRQALNERINTLLRQDPEQTVEQIQTRLLPDTPRTISTPASRALRRQFQRVTAMRQLHRFSQPVREKLTPMVPAQNDLPPIEQLARVIDASAYVDYLPHGDGVVRSMPMWAEYRGRLYPQYSLALVCLRLGIDVRDVKIEPDRVVIPRTDEPDIVIPTNDLYVRAADKTYGGFIEIPWFGPAEGWEEMYDWPDYQQPDQHIPVTKVWEVVETRRRIIKNNREIDFGIRGIYGVMDPGKVESFEQNPFPPADVESRAKLAESILKDAAPFVQMFEQMSDEEFDKYLADLPDDAERRKNKFFVNAAKTLPVLVDKSRQMQKDMVERQRELKDAVRDKTVIIGWTATSAIADFVPTSLHAKAPGPIVHGVIYSGIMTGDLWRHVDDWFNPAAVICMGLLATIIVGALSPLWGTLAAGVLIAGWALLNGVVMFDYGNLVAAPGAPMIAIALVWAGCTMLRYITERTERARITRRFRSYVDPALVNYVIEHPESAHLEGEEKELTVVFTDLAGFTSVSERLGTATIGIINEYMGRMVPVIRQHHGYVNKFLGDGIMFFYGAPRENKHHAPDAVKTIMQMQRELTGFNQQLAERDLPEVKMRVGVATGKMIVGDAGPPDAADYTVLGDVVNLSARLESANKATGTLMMIADRTLQLLDGAYLTRPLARLQVVGKTEGVTVHEPLCEVDRATDDLRRLVELTETMFNRYIKGEFAATLEAAEALDEACGKSKLTDLYRESCRLYMVHPPDHFTGQIVLASK